SMCEMPCMFGIRPENTSSSSMLKIIQNHPYFRSLARTEVVNPLGKLYKFEDRNQLITIQLNSRDVVQQISWGNNSCNPDWLPTVADIILVLGNPSLVFVESTQSVAITYVYTNFHIEIASNRENI